MAEFWVESVHCHKDQDRGRVWDDILVRATGIRHIWTWACRGEGDTGGGGSLNREPGSSMCVRVRVHVCELHGEENKVCICSCVCIFTEKRERDKQTHTHIYIYIYTHTYIHMHMLFNQKYLTKNKFISEIEACTPTSSKKMKHCLDLRPTSSGDFVARHIKTPVSGNAKTSRHK